MIAATLAVATVALAPAAAVGAVLGSDGGVQYRKVSENVGAPAPGGVAGAFESLECAEDDAALGGGLFVDGASSEARILSSLPIDLDFPYDAWRTGLENYGSAKTVDTYAFCRRAGAGGLRTVHRQITVGPNQADEASAPCPRGTHLVGGGAGMDEFDSWLNDTAPFDGGDADSRPDDGWRGSVYNGRDAVGFLDVEAVCAEAGVLDVAIRRGTAADVGSGQTGTATAPCPRGSVLITLGVGIQGPPRGAFINTLYPLNSDADTLPDDIAFTHLHHLSAAAKEATVYAFCRA